MSAELSREDFELNEVIRNWWARASAVEKAHFRRCAIFRTRHVILGCVAIAVTSLLGVSAQLDNKIPILEGTTLTGILTVVAPVITGLVSFLRFDEKSNMHHNAAARFAAMKRKLQIMNGETSIDFDSNKVKRELFQLCEKWDTLTIQAPALYRREAKKLRNDIEKNKKGIEENETKLTKQHVGSFAQLVRTAGVSTEPDDVLRPLSVASD